MKIYEIKSGTKCFIQVTHNDKSGKFRASAVKAEGDGIMVVVPDFPRDKKITFDKQDVSVFCFFTTRPPVIWHDVTVSYKKGFYILSTKNDGEIFNRRTAPRIRVNAYGELTAKGEKLSVLVKDMSETGFAVIDPKNKLTLEKTDKVALEFADLDYTFSVKGKVKRIKEGDATLYGCLITAIEGGRLTDYLKKRERANKS